MPPLIIESPIWTTPILHLDLPNLNLGNYCKFCCEFPNSNIQTWQNPDQKAPIWALWSGSELFEIIAWVLYSWLSVQHCFNLHRFQPAVEVPERRNQIKRKPYYVLLFFAGSFTCKVYSTYTWDFKFHPKDLVQQRIRLETPRLTLSSV